MATALSSDQCQRWFAHRSFFRPSQEPIDPTEFGVELIEQKTAKAFVVRHHYSGSFPYSIQSVGLFRKTGGFEQSRLVGVATFATPSNPHSIERWCGLPNDAGAELGRFVLLDECAGNAETWFLVRAMRQFKAVRPRIKCVLSYSDPHPRRNACGEVIFPGHAGGIYGAANAYYCGRASPKSLFISPTGRVIANRILSKLRNGEQGRQYAERLLTDFTGAVREETETPSAFVERALSTMRVERHAGNHLYVFPLAADRREKNAIIQLPVLQSHIRTPYPKFPDQLAA